MKKLLLLIPLWLITNQLKADSICSVINTPGISQLGGDALADPTDTNDSMYCINVSNVIFDLGGFNIAQDPSNRIAGFNAINISPGLSNIVIRNGTVQGMTGVGIFVGAGCNNISLENMSVIDCDATGILFNGNSASVIQDGLVDNCLIYSCTGANGNPAYGLRLIYCDNINVQGSTFDRNDAGDTNNGYGISSEWCTTCRFGDCEVNANGGMSLGVGINIYNSQWSIIQNCNAINTVGRGTGSASAIGFLIDTSNHTTISNCISKHNNNVLAEAYAFKATNGSDNLFSNCEANQTIGGTIAAGFLFNNTESASSIINSQARVNNGGTAGTGYGILLDTAQNCDILFNNLTNNNGLVGVGLKDTVVDTTNLIAGTVSFNNATAGYQVSRTTGSFPVITASLGDFSTTLTSKYVNINFIQ